MSKLKKSIKKIALTIAKNKVVTAGLVAALALAGLSVPEEVVTAVATIVAVMPL